MKRIGTTLASVVLILSILGAVPQPARAIAVIDFFNGIFNKASSVANTITAAEAKIKPVLDLAAFLAAHQALIGVTQQMVKFVNTGFNGKPAFITSLSQNLLEVQDTSATKFFDSLLSSGSINSPFRDLIAKNLREDYFRSTGAGAFSVKNKFTLGDSCADPQSVLKGDISKCGLKGFFAASQQQNNPLGFGLLAREGLAQQTQSAIENRKTEANWGNGYLSFRGSSCGKTTNVASTINAPTATVTRGSTSGAFETLDSVSVSGTSATNGGTSNSPKVSLTKLDELLDCAIKTPANAIAEGLNHQLGTNSDSLVNIHFSGEFITSLFSKVVGWGLNGLSGESTQGTAGDGTARTAQDVVATDASSAFLKLLDNQTSLLNQYQANWQKLQGAAQGTEAALVGAPSSCSINGDTPDSARTSFVEPLLTQSATALASIPGALSTIASIRADASSNDTERVADASTKFQALFSTDAAYPQPDDIGAAASEASDTDPNSTYSQLQSMATQAIACGND